MGISQGRTAGLYAPVPACSVAGHRPTLTTGPCVYLMGQQTTFTPWFPSVESAMTPIIEGTMGWPNPWLSQAHCTTSR